MRIAEQEDQEVGGEGLWGISERNHHYASNTSDIRIQEVMIAFDNNVQVKQQSRRALACWRALLTRKSQIMT